MLGYQPSASTLWIQIWRSKNLGPSVSGSMLAERYAGYVESQNLSGNYCVLLTCGIENTCTTLYAGKWLVQQWFDIYRGWRVVSDHGSNLIVSDPGDPCQDTYPIG